MALPDLRQDVPVPDAPTSADEAAKYLPGFAIQNVGRPAPRAIPQEYPPQPINPSDVLNTLGGIGRYLNRYASPAGIGQEALGAGQSVLRQLGELKDAPWSSLFQPTGPARAGYPKGKPTEASTAAATEIGGRALGLAAAPFSIAAGAIIERQVALDPDLAPKFQSQLDALPKDQQNDAGRRSDIAHRLIDSQAAQLIHAIDDPNRSDAEKRAAFVAASLLTLERVAEFGGPQVVQQIASLGRNVAIRIASTRAGNQAMRVEGGLAQRIGAEPQPAVEQPNVTKPASPQAVAEGLRSAGFQESEIVSRLRSQFSMSDAEAARVARTYADVGAKAQNASAEFAAELERAQKRVPRRALQLSSQALEGQTPSGITVAQGDELLRHLDQLGVPADIRSRVAATIDSARTTEAQAKAEGRISTQAERQAARADFAAAQQEARSAVTGEGQAGRRLSRAEQDLAVREAGLQGAESQASARAVLAQEREAAVRTAEAQAAARVPADLEARLNTMEKRLTDSFGSVTSAPTQVARALRAEAKRTRSQTRNLPKRGLIGERVSQTDFGGQLGDVVQSEAQRAYGSGLARGTNTYRKTSDRISLEALAIQYDELARAINKAQRDIQKAGRDLRDAGRPLQSPSAEERTLLGRSASYRDFMGVDPAAVDAQINAADAAAHEATVRLHRLLQEAKDLGIRPHQVEEAQRLIEGLRADVVGIRGVVNRAREFRANSPEAQIADEIHAEVARGRAVIEDAALRSSEPVRAGTTDEAGIPVETGYAAPRDEELLAEFGANIGKWDSPTSRKAMADAIRANPDKFRAAVESMTYDEILARVADKSGTTVETLRAALPKRGELAARLLAADFGLDKTAGDLVNAGKALKKQTITQEDFDTAYARHLDLQLAASEGTSETARALSAKKVRKVENAPFELLQADRRVKDAEKALASTERELEREATNAAKSESDAATILAKADTADPATANQMRAVATRSLEQARERVAQARAKVEAARIEHEAAIERAAEASDKAHAAYLRSAIVQGFSKDQVTILAQMDTRDVAGIHNFVRLNKPLRAGEKLGAYLLNNTYGSIPSLESNFINTGLHFLYQNAVVRPLSRVTGAAIGRVAGEAVVVPGEVQAAWVGIYHAIPDATRLFMRTVLNGEDPATALKYGLVGIDRDSAMKFGVAPRPIVPGPLGLPIEGVLRVLGGSDGFWRVLDTAAESRALVVRDAYARGLRGDQIGKALAEFTAHPTPETLARASTVSLRTTFNDPAEVGSITHRFLHLLNKDVGGFAPLRILIPAARFGIAAAHHSVNLSGYGLFSGARLAREAGHLQGLERTAVGRQAAREAAEGVLGVMMILTASQMWDAGLLTGSLPDDPIERERWRKQGKQPNSILIGGHWVPQSAVGPLAAPFVLTALLRDQMDQSTDKELSDRISRGARAIGAYLADMPAFQGTYQLLDTMYAGLKYGATEGVQRFAALNLARFVPESATLNSLVPVWDPYERDYDGLVDRIKGRIPGASLSLPARSDRFGQPSPRRLTGVEALSPSQGTAPRPLDRVEQGLLDAGVNVGFVADSIGGEKLSAVEQRQYQQIAGTRAYRAAERVLDSAAYNSESDPAARKRMLDSAINKERDAARAVIAERLIDNALTDPEVTRGAKMLRSTIGNIRQLAYAYESMTNSGRMTPAVRAELDATRGFVGGSQREPTVAEMVRVAPLIHQYLSIPPYRIGNRDEWSRLAEARKQMADYEDKNPRPANVTEINWYARIDPQGALLIRRYNDPDARSPQRKRLLDQHPELLPYLEVNIRVPATNLTSP